MLILSDSRHLGKKFQELADIMKKLRAPGGCPWDGEQTHMTLRRYILEEAYELIEAIEDGNNREICEECGDVLLQPVFVACISEEKGDFDLYDVLDAITSKLIRRHPHVFADGNAKTSEDVLKKWEQIKAGERKSRNDDRSMLAGVPRGLPALLRAYRMQEKAAKTGFDWPKDSQDPVLAKVKEELGELEDALRGKEKTERVAEEFGDMLFAMVNLARHMDLDAETVLHRACEKFASRFASVEKSAAERGKTPSEFSLEELERFWQEAKKSEKSQ